MAARHEEIKLTRAVWTELTNGSVTAISFQIKAGSEVLIAGTTGATAPTSEAQAWRYGAGQGESNRALTDMFPGIAATRVWARFDAAEDARVMVSHA